MVIELKCQTEWVTFVQNITLVNFKGLTSEELLLSGHLVENDSIQSQTYKESLKTTNKRNSPKRQRFATPDTDVSAKSSEAGELAEDLLLIVMVFVVRYNRMCSATNQIETQTLDGNSTIDLQSVSHSS
ncbi:6308_t:CDS:2 [Funneliformis geosporum]|uniref:6308_t:CDS:1 n=1 Tax=Funneliformis geosporum TaxID=1117311 RepID=A0A9W4SDR9_9GLOM|nr:6308_t:CDS:2 [Funneliformis geosporum]